ncbi:AAA family ATPase [Dyella sp. GSA-30]|uniref:AAA family ATPase n=1 Tax=Dyella sp. GSA-30 TaxID=2994496 RepID=UPI00248FC4EF|nr:AAA family ATPase [Dyella sp. GSA-30]BDU21630.1 hypothetical protein DYGSA30_30870 [Dyella sp. GSA-30]
MIAHPMLRDARPLIATRCIEGLAEAIKIAIEDGHQGIQVQGRSRDGKTKAAIYLQTHPSWLDDSAYIFRITMPRRSNHSDTAFYKTIQSELGLSQHSHSGSVNRIRQISDRIIAGCLGQESTQAVLFVDEAQQLSDDDFEYLTNIDNAVTDGGFRLFCVFIHQSDDTKAEKRKKRSSLVNNLPPHVIGRFFMASHTFSGLRGAADISHALDQYDSRLRFEGKTFTEFFAGQAFASGWRLASHANDFVSAISAIRKRSNLKGSGDLAMKIFDVVCYRLLVRVAAETPNFAGLSKELIEKVILDSGYLLLEVARQRQAAA